MASPFYPPYVNFVTALGIQPVIIEAGADTRFQSGIVALERLHSSPDGRFIAILCNPASTMQHPNELAEISRWCRAHGVRLIGDEIYPGLDYESPLATAASLSSNRPGICVVLPNPFSYVAAQNDVEPPRNTAMAGRACPGILPGLTGLRFFAAAWVVAYHFVWWLTPPGMPIPVIPVIAQGHLGVDFFFILSGFVLTHAHLDQTRAANLKARQFFIKRLARIYPMHLVTLLFFLALMIGLGTAGIRPANPERYTGLQFFLNLLLVQAWQTQDVGSWNFPSWSVSAEWFAYLLFPLLSFLFVVRLARVRAEFLVAACVAFLVACQALAPIVFGPDFFDLHSNFGYVRILPEFVLGIALYRLGTERRLPALESSWAVTLLAGAMLILSLLQWDLLLVLVMGVLILAAAEISRQGRHDLLSSFGIIYLGEISYSIYMIHFPVAQLLLHSLTARFGWLSLWSIPLLMLVIIGVAAASHRLIEVPARQLVLQLAKHPRRRPQPMSMPTHDELTERSLP